MSCLQKGVFDREPKVPSTVVQVYFNDAPEEHHETLVMRAHSIAPMTGGVDMITNTNPIFTMHVNALEKS